MDIFIIVGIGLLSAVCALLIKQIKPELTVLVTLSGSILILLLIIQSLGGVFDVFKSIVDKTGVGQGLFSSILKVIGIGYLVEFASNICIDAGSSSIADKILLAGKVLILIVCMPILTNLIEIILALIP